MLRGWRSSNAEGKPGGLPGQGRNSLRIRADEVLAKGKSRERKRPWTKANMARTIEAVDTGCSPVRVPEGLNDERESLG